MEIKIKISEEKVNQIVTEYINKMINGIKQMDNQPQEKYIFDEVDEELKQELTNSIPKVEWKEVIPFKNNKPQKFVLKDGETLLSVVGKKHYVSDVNGFVHCYKFDKQNNRVEYDFPMEKRTSDYVTTLAYNEAGMKKFEELQEKYKMMGSKLVRMNRGKRIGSYTPRHLATHFDLYTRG